MRTVIGWLNGLAWRWLILGSLTLGLAPFTPQPHLLEKLALLFAGELVRWIDVFDLFMHAAFPALLIAKLLVGLATRNGAKAPTGGGDR